MNKNKIFNYNSNISAVNNTQLVVPRSVAIIGLGRWGKIMTRVLASFDPKIKNIFLVAERNYSDVKKWVDSELLKGFENDQSNRFTILKSINNIKNNKNIDTVFITKMAAEHYSVTKSMLLSNKHVFVEKPFVLDVEEAEELIQLSEKKDRVLFVGYEFMMARHIHYFKDKINEKLPDITSIEIKWEDITKKIKWGIKKQQDLSSNIITDLYPHILSFLYVILGNKKVLIKNFESVDGYFNCKLKILYGDIPVSISLNKQANKANRSIKVKSSSKGNISLNFTNEPGKIKLNSHTVESDNQWDQYLRPLNSEIAHFFSELTKPINNLPTLAKNSINIVSATQDANTVMNDIHTNLILDSIKDGEIENPSKELITIFRHKMLSPLLNAGLLKNPKDEDSLDKWVIPTIQTIQNYMVDPFTEQKSILNNCQLNKKELIKLNAVIRSISFLQNLMFNEGLSEKYWTSIIPLVRSGAINDVLSKKYRFPLRIGIYPGVSCMFNCSFCGRMDNPSAKYKRVDLLSGNDIFYNIFNNIPKNYTTTFSFSGGLEPLTNPNIGELITVAAKNGIRVQMFTNAFMLTPIYVARQKGLWDLDSLRVSLYGVDEESTFAVAEKKGAYELVKKNIIEFIKLRNKNNPKLKFGLNFIVLMKNYELIMKLFQYILEINNSIDNGKGIDFLTLREDFSVTEMDGLSAESRIGLIETFKEFNDECKEKLPSLHVDYGYSLVSLAKGKVGKPLAMVDYKGMRTGAYPQVSVVVDLKGDVFLYREAGFLDRPGNERFKIGRITPHNPLEKIISNSIINDFNLKHIPDDTKFMDAFDHLVTKLLNQAESDKNIGITFNEGPIEQRVSGIINKKDSTTNPTIMNNWYN